MGRPNLGRLRAFVRTIVTIVDEAPSEPSLLEAGAQALRELVSQDDWLPEAFARPNAPYAQYLLHCDSRERFSVVGFVWSPGQVSPIHDHRVWGLIGILRGEEIDQPYRRHRDEAGAGRLAAGTPTRLRAGQVSAVSPGLGDIHQVANPLEDQTAVSIHVYGGNIGAVERSRFDAEGNARRFVSGYSNTMTPNLWGGPWS
jgi:predicted metal-dependent enzyme (double-stranded beta helix superfamily)